MSREAKDGMACFLTAFVILVVLIAAFSVLTDNKETYMGQIVNISVTDRYMGSVCFWGTLDTGRVVRVNHNASIGEKYYLKETRFASWILNVPQLRQCVP